MTAEAWVLLGFVVYLLAMLWWVGHMAHNLADIANHALDREAALWEAVWSAVIELDAEHTPQWASDQARGSGKEPIGCAICWPADGHWPCTSRMVADDLRKAVEG